MIKRLKQPIRFNNINTLLSIGFSSYLIITSLLILIGWSPHNLVWPTICDWDMPAKAALWDLNGLTPYKDFSYGATGPGQIYLWKIAFIIGGTEFGKIIANLIDQLMVISICILAIIWSKKNLKLYNPGLLISLGWLAKYSSLHFGHVAQRDWHAIFFVVVSLITIQIVKSKTSFWISAILFSFSGMFRPYVVFAIPAILYAVSRINHNKKIYDEEKYKKCQVRFVSRISNVILWTIISAFAYIVINSILLSFEGFQTHMTQLFGFLGSGGYSDNPVTGFAVFKNILRFMIFGRYFFVPCCLILLIFIQRNDPFVNRIIPNILPWILLYFGTIVWMSSYPNQDLDAYVQIPNHLLQIILIGIIYGILCNLYLIPDNIRVILMPFFISSIFLTKPLYVSFVDSYNAIYGLSNGLTTYIPICQKELIESQVGDAENYLRLLSYLKQLDSDVRICNILVGKPQCFTADTGRLDINPSCAFTVESYYGRLQIASKEDVISEIEKNLSNVVIVWTPSQKVCSEFLKHYRAPISSSNKEFLSRMDLLRNYVSEKFLAEKEFGEIGIWKSKIYRSE